MVFKSRMGGIKYSEGQRLAVLRDASKQGLKDLNRVCWAVCVSLAFFCALGFAVLWCIQAVGAPACWLFLSVLFMVLAWYAIEGYEKAVSYP